MVERPATHQIGAVVVLFHADESMRANIASYAEQVGRVVAVDNTPAPPAERAKGLAAVNVDYVAFGENRGIAAALNAGIDRLRTAGFTWALTMDQDSTAPVGFVDSLCRCLDADADDVAIVAPVWQQVGGIAEQTDDSCRELDWAMTSGNLLRLAAVESIGGFDEALFIDQVDNDLCFRLRLDGWRILQARRALLQHRQGSMRKTPLGFWVTDYPAIRRYYMTRNTLVMHSRYGAQFPAWGEVERAQWMRDLVKIVLGEPNKIAKIRAILLGVGDARTRRLGRYEELHP